jgi:hypothetical protein
VADEQAAAGRERVDQRRHQAGRLLLVHDLVQDAAQHQADRLVPVEQLAGGGEDAFGVTQVALDRERPLVVGQQRRRVRHHHRVVVQVNDAHVRVVALGDLMDVLRGGQARADIEQLGHPRVADQVADRPGENIALHPHACLRGGHAGQDPLGQRPVDREIVTAAEQVVVNARTIRTGRVDLGRLGHVRTLKPGTRSSEHNREQSSQLRYTGVTEPARHRGCGGGT